MSRVYPFRALRPDGRVASRVASVPYDVVNTDEARALAEGNPLSFLHVTRSEIDLVAGTDPYDASVYAKARSNFERLKSDAPLLVDPEPSLYIYRLRMGGHEQVGLAGCFSVDDYDNGFIKKHEKTRKDKEDDRTRHITDLRAQTGLVFLTYPAVEEVKSVTVRIAQSNPVYDFVAPDGVAHTVWRATGADCDRLVKAFAAVDALYIADGHHRAASASRARAALGSAGTGGVDSQRFIAVAFPDDEMQILPYNRVVKDLAGQTPQSFLAALGRVGSVGAGGPMPDRAGDVSVYLDGRWYGLRLPKPGPDTAHADRLDVEVLQRHILQPLLNVTDPRTDKRIDFVGGIRGPAELERLVRSGQAAVAFSMFPVTIGDLMQIADAGGIMPPKSTWFEPKLRDGLLTHPI